MLFLAISRYLLMQAADANDCEPGQIQQKGAVLSVAYVTRLFLEKDPDAILVSLQALLSGASEGIAIERERGGPFPGVR